MRPNRKRTHRARQPRQTQTVYEGIMWRLLRDRRMEGHKFRRQHPIESFIADFACIESKLIIELDGNSHNERTEGDEIRDQFLCTEGWHTLRVRNSDLMSNGNGVVLTLLTILSS